MNVSMFVAEVVDEITCDKLFGDRLRDVDSVGGVQKWTFPTDWSSGWLPVNTSDTTAQLSGVGLGRFLDSALTK